MMLRIELDTVRKYRNQNEYHTMQRARCAGHEVVGYGYVVKRLVGILRAENPQISGHVEVWRRSTRVFGPMPLKTAFLTKKELEALV